MIHKVALAGLQLVTDNRAGTLRTAHRAQFNYQVKPGFIYVCSRAISSRTNENFDTFPAEEIKKAWRTFIGKPVFVNHKNEDHQRARGVVIDAALHEDRNPDGSPDTWVEVLMEVDALKFPELARRVVAGEIDRTSMGTAVAYTVCSYCGNKAQTPLEYCRHVRALKGQRIVRTTASGEKEAVLVSELCYGLHFFENSLLVEDPADPTAIAYGVDTRGLSLTGSLSQRTASRLGHNHRSSEGFPAPRDIQAVKTAARASTTRDPRTAAAFRRLASFCPMDPEPEPVLTRTAALREAAGPRYPDPSQHPFYQGTPVHPDNVVARWQEATPEDKEQGMRWYSDANLVAKALGNGDTHKGAGVLAAYSPQTLWPVNMHNAARALASGVAPGGKGSGVFATASMANQAQRIINGERHENVLKGPKIQDFAHLIEHGGDADPEQPHVVVDRHAMSVAAGHRLSDQEMGKAPLQNRHYYTHTVNAYKEAAKRISELEGHPVAPHQVQAATWLVQQRKNAQEDLASGKPMEIGRDRARQKAEDSWNTYAHEHYPDLGGPGYYTGAIHQGLGEQTAPPKVDTLMPDSCPICGENDPWRDGDTCMKCGYINTPAPFDTPDTDVAADTEDLPEQQLGGEEPKPPLYMGRRNIPTRTTYREDPGMPNNRNQQAQLSRNAAANLHMRLGQQQQMLNQQQEQMNAIGSTVSQMDQHLRTIAAFLTRTADGVPPQFQKNDSGSGSSSSDSGGSDSVDKDSPDYKAGYSDAQAGKDKDPSKSGNKNYSAGYSAGKKSDSDSDDDGDSDDTKTSSLRERRMRQYVASKQGRSLRTADDNVPTSNEQARKPDATDDPENVGASPASANTGVTPDASTTPDSTNTVLNTDDATKVDVDSATPSSVSSPPPVGQSHVPNDVIAPNPPEPTKTITDGSGWTGVASKEDPQARFFTALKLARTRKQLGLIAEDFEIHAQKIVDDPKMTSEAMALLQEQLDAVVTAAKNSQAVRQRSAGMVPRPAAQPAAAGQTTARRMPSIGGGGADNVVGGASTGTVSGDEFGDL